jgi:prolyl oligopeptidase
VDYAKPSKAHWNVILAEGADVLQHVDIVGSTLVATYLHDASSRIERYDLRGKALGAIELPALGTAYVSGPDEGTEAFLSFTSFVVPTQVLRADLKTGKTALWDRVGASFVAPSVTVRREYATSKDGTKVPMFVVEKEGARRDGTAPALLWGYGGFNQNTTPAFSARALAMVERGGVWVSAVLRGGGEFGEDWHRGGMLANKQNVFDDFVACAEWLVLEKVAAADRLAVGGGSNGGLLTSAVITQRPELFRAALSLVPLTDMLRYHHFRIAKLWIPEYGSADDADQFKVLYAYSPYHRVRDGVKYPAVLYTTAESDTRVDPMHARKMAARLQLAQSSSDRPMLVRIEEKAGHGAGKPVTKLTEEVTDEMIFLFGQLGMNNSRK